MDFAARAARRRQAMTIRICRQAVEPHAIQGTPADRLAAMWSVALDAWTLSGKQLPDYARSEIPIRMFQRGDAG